MRHWVDAQLAAARQTAPSTPVVILDPAAVVEEGDLPSLGGARAWWVDDWWGLRRTYEWHVRYRSLHAERAVMVVRSPDFTEPRDLPWDIGEACAICSVHLPVPRPLAPVVLALSPEQQDAAVQAVMGATDPLGAVLRAVWGVQLPAATAAGEVDATLRLRTDTTAPPALWPLLRDRLTHPLAVALAADPPDMGLWQTAWREAVLGDGGPHRAILDQLGHRLAPLFHLGLLQPVATRPEGRRSLPPAWAAFGLRPPSAIERARALLTAQPPFQPDQPSTAWPMLAAWWGELRCALAQAAPATDAADAWGRWQEIDTAFEGWLRGGGLAGALLSPRPWPAAVHQIAPFLARRLRERRARRIALIVMDGMAFAQWAAIREWAGLHTLQAGGVLAMVPTLTSISRQAIFAGQRPSEFPRTLQRTDHDAAVWEAFWLNEGLPQAEVFYTRLPGRADDALPNLGGASVAGVVIEAVDHMLHRADLFGESQLLATLKAWTEQGALRQLVEHMISDGFEVWVTSDHGNLEASAAGRVAPEGVAVEAAGLRVRCYATSALRATAAAEGLVWDPPGLPAGTLYPLFAAGRQAYFQGGPRMVHGGCSLDEVVVPLVQVAI